MNNKNPTEFYCAGCLNYFPSEKELQNHGHISGEEFKLRSKSVDMVNHPPHYTSHPKNIECIDVIEDCSNFNLATAIKYLWRVAFGTKSDPVEDLKKAQWYIQRELDRRNV